MANLYPQNAWRIGAIGYGPSASVPDHRIARRHQAPYQGVGDGLRPSEFAPAQATTCVLTCHQRSFKRLEDVDGLLILSPLRAVTVLGFQGISEHPRIFQSPCACFFMV